MKFNLLGIHIGYLLVCGALCLNVSHFAVAQETNSGHVAALKKAKAMWALMMGSNLPTSGATRNEILNLIEKKQFQEAGRFALASPESKLILTKVREWAIPLISRDGNMEEPEADFVVKLVAGTSQSLTLQEMLTTEREYSFANSRNSSYSGQLNVGVLNQFVLDANLRSTSKASQIANPPEGTIKNKKNLGGLLTTQQFGKAAFEGGTNRRPIKLALERFLCTDLSKNMIFHLPDTWVGHDIDRFSGAAYEDPDPSKTYREKCSGCHIGMDAARGAFAYLDFGLIDQTLKDQTQVQDKMNNGKVGSLAGHTVKDSQFLNYWIRDANTKKVHAYKDMKLKIPYDGMKDFVGLIAQSPELGPCMVRSVVSAVCPNVRNKYPQIYEKFVSARGEVFSTAGRLDELFADVVTQFCLGDRK